MTAIPPPEHGDSDILLISAVLFAGSALIGLVLLLPDTIERLRRRLQTSMPRAGQALRRRLSLRSRQVTHALAHRDGIAGRMAGAVRRHRWPLAALCLLGIIASLTLTLGADGSFVTTYERTSHQRARIEGGIAALFSGEKLTPPSPLPPALFATREVEFVRPKLATANRKWDRLDDVFVQRLLRAYALMKERHGYDMVLIEGFRSPERQNELAAMGPHVTRAAAFQSYHQFGLAADNAFLRDGKIVIGEKDAWAMRGYELFGEIAASLGLTWGGNWTMRDLGHVELRPPG